MTRRDALKAAKREYHRLWREKHPENVKAAQKRFWDKKAQELLKSRELEKKMKTKELTDGVMSVIDAVANKLSRKPEPFSVEQLVEIIKQEAETALAYCGTDFDISPLPAIKKLIPKKQKALLDALYDFARVCILARCYGSGLYPAEAEIAELHSDNIADLNEFKEQLYQWLFDYAIVEDSGDE